MQPLSDTDLVSLAAGASQDAAMTARLELYPRSLDPRKALRLAQAASYLGEPGLEPNRLRDRVLARFPELADLPDPGQLRKLLQDMGHTVNVTRDADGITRYVIPGGALAGSWSSTRGPTSMAGYPGDRDGGNQAAAAGRRRARWFPRDHHQAGGDRTGPRGAGSASRRQLVQRDRSVPRRATRDRQGTRQAALGERARGRRRRRDARRAGRVGLLDAVWERLDKQVRAMPGTVMLHHATPLGRYAGGIQLLSRLAAYARQADEAPYGLWLLCPMDDPRKPALLDEQTVATLGENEQLVVRPAAAASTTRRAS